MLHNIGGGKLMQLFQQIDCDQDGVISWSELKQHGLVVERFPGDVGVLLGDAQGSDWRGAGTAAHVHTQQAQQLMCIHSRQSRKSST